MELCIWHIDGDTSYFLNVENLETSDKVIKFDYFGQASQKQKRATFNLDQIAGWSIEISSD